MFHNTRPLPLYVSQQDAFFCPGVITWKLAQPLIQQKNSWTMNTSGTEYYNLVKTCLKPYSTSHKHTQHTTMINMSFSLYFHGNIHHCPKFWLCALYGSISSPWHWVKLLALTVVNPFVLGHLRSYINKRYGRGIGLRWPKLDKNTTTNWQLEFAIETF